MARYIDADKTRKQLLEDHLKSSERVKQIIIETIIKAIDITPTADVRPERHGRWIDEGEVVVCSECGEEHAWDTYRATYCEDCGAKMDGDAK